MNAVCRKSIARLKIANFEESVAMIAIDSLFGQGTFLQYFFTVLVKTLL